MTTLTVLTQRLTAPAERIDALSLRERLLIFASGITLACLAWQILCMDPLNARARAAAQQLSDSSQQLNAVDRIGSVSDSDPLVAAANRNRALERRLGELDAQLHELAHDYVGPEQVTDLLQTMLSEQHGLQLVSLKNLPSESMARDPAQSNSTEPVAADRGPFLHPVELTVEGDYASITAYLRALEQMPWRVHWRRLVVVGRDYPVNRATLVVGAMSLSRDWIQL
jgi:MSHA biogenesis protein MshJ